MRYSNLKLNIS